MLFEEDEIIDWWYRERQRIFLECTTFNERLTALSSSQIDALPDGELLKRKSDARDRIRAYAKGEMHKLNQRLGQSLQVSFEASQQQVESRGLHLPEPVSETTVYNLASTMDVSALGLAAAATGMAATTGSVLWILPVGLSFSWPIFLGVGAVAISAVSLSPVVRSKALARARNTYREAVATQIRRHVLDGTPKGQTSILQHYLTLLDGLRDQRIERLHYGS